MGRKRPFGDDVSSEDDFLPSDVSASPPRSRLKRKRRASTRSQVASRNSTQSNDEKRHQSEVICIPESPEAEEEISTSVQQSPVVVDATDEGRELSNSVEQSRRGEEEGRESIAEGGEGDESEAGGANAHRSEELEDGDDSHDDAAGLDNSVQGDASMEDGSQGVERRSRRESNHDANPSSFDEVDDSEPESEDVEDEAYNSCEDSPDEEDEESDFAPSGKRASRKPKQRSQKSAPAARAKKSAPTRSSRAITTAVGKKATHGSKGNSKVASEGAGATRKALGARIRTGLSSLSRKTTEGMQKQERSMTVGRSHVVYRAGLSRNATIPRLHSYLK